MQSELTCPHCGSTLNFGIEILAGTPVECLICMQTFTATPNVAAPQTPKAPAAKVAVAAPAVAKPAGAKPAVAKPASKAESTPVSKPYIAAGAPPPTPPAPPPLPRPSVKRNQSTDASKILLLAVGVALLLVLSAGFALALWKISSAFRSGPKTEDPVAEATTPAPPDKVPAKKPDEPQDPGAAPAEDVEWKKEKQKILIERKKKLFNEGADLEFNDVGGVPAFPKKKIPGLEPEKVNAAIQKGIIYLKSTQHVPAQTVGTWAVGHGHNLGHAAIGGLTLLECGVPPNDISVQRAAFFVRSNIASNSMTYEMSLAILFLARLGDPRDRPSIQGMALRLLAGQNDSGGWSYGNPILPPDQMYQLLAFLQSHNRMQNPTGGNPKLLDPLKADEKNKEDPFHRLNDMILTKDLEGHANPEFKGVLPMPKIGKGIPPNWLRAELQNLPVVQNQGKAKGKGKFNRGGDGDNSNTQFALMGLWTARRYGVPVDQAILSSYQRFEMSQNGDGGWGYHMTNGSTNTMTCVGLIGQAMGHGVSPEIIAINPKNPKQVLFKPVLEDQAVQRGLTRLSAYIDEPSMDPNKTKFAMENLYFLWSVERVAMLYDLKYINGRDWYGWGAQILVHNQAADGSWPTSQYHGSNAPLNTCFALLFLRRSNLVQDLTNNLRLHSAIPDSPR